MLSLPAVSSGRRLKQPMAKNNKKVLNATSTTIDGVAFKSLFEARVYKYLKDNSYSFAYEVERVNLQESFKPTSLFMRKTTKGFDIDPSVVRAITYTPDFLIYINDYKVYVECKGFKTDSYNIKVKLFRKWLQNKDNTIFIEVKSIRELTSAIDYIKQL